MKSLRIVLSLALVAAGSSVPGQDAPPARASGGEREKTPTVLEFLSGISGKQTVAGVHNREPNSVPDLQTNAIHDLTGKYPGLWSGDFLFKDDDVNARWAMIYEARKQWESGSIVQLMFHVAPPNLPEDNCPWEGGIMSHLSDEEWIDLVTDGGALNKAWKSRLDRYARYLKYLQDYGVTVLFRPYHEMNQGRFWWGGRPGPDGTARLYRLTHDYLVRTKGLTSLIWVWDMQDMSRDFAEYNPGDDYWDIFAFDIYEKGYDKSWYDYILPIVGDKPMAIGECAVLPTAEILAAQPRWVFFMSWSELTFTRNSPQQIKDLYALPNVVTRERLPRFRPVTASASGPTMSSSRRRDATEDIPTFKPVEVSPEGRITFHMYAPAAQSVEVRGEAVMMKGLESLPMTKDEKGVWTATLSGLRPELYSYLYMVDGAPTMDQRNPGAKVGPRGNSNRFEMPGQPDFYGPRAVPHGKVEINWHHSAILDQVRSLWVYTPPGYDASSSKRYPVLFLLHGSGDLEGGWTEDGHANFILDNLIAAGKAKPMIVVMPRGHVLSDRQIDRETNNAQLEQVLVKELIPFVDAHYRTQADREHRAITGLSMGGGQSLRFGLRNLDLFAWVIGLSPAIGTDEAQYTRLFGDLLSRSEQSDAAVKLLMVRCGSKDHLITASDTFTQFLAAKKIEHSYVRSDYESLWPGRRDDHNWPVWRADLREVAQLLFK